MDLIFLSSVPDSKGLTTLQKLYLSDNILGTFSFNQYVFLKISDHVKILCKLVPQLISANSFGNCDSSVIKHAPNKLIDPFSIKLELPISKKHIEPVCVSNAKRMAISIVFKGVKHQNKWSKNHTKLSEAVRQLLRLFVVHNDCIVNLKRLKLKQNFNIDFILIHKTDDKNNAVCITSETSITVIKTMSSIQFYHTDIGLKLQPLFGLETQVTSLKNIIKAARNGFNPLCNMVCIWFKMCKQTMLLFFIFIRFY